MPWNDCLDPATATWQIASSQNPRIRVLAGPGTGKSFAMKRRVARLLESGVDPRKILPITFTRVGAEDLHRELVGMNVPGCTKLYGRTLHSLALRILMRNHVLAATGRIPRPLNEFELEPLLSDLRTHGGKKRLGRRSLHTRQLGPDFNTRSLDTPKIQQTHHSKTTCWTGSFSTSPC